MLSTVCGRRTNFKFNFDVNIAASNAGEKNKKTIRQQVDEVMDDILESER